MSDTNTTVTPAAPTVTIDPNAPKQGAPAQPEQENPNEKPHWLAGRLERERNAERSALLKELGIESVDDAKKSIQELNAKREAEKTAAQKATELESKLNATKAEKAAMAEALGAYAKSAMAKLTDAQRAAVTAVAGEDAAKQLKTIDALTPTWANAPAALSTETKTEKPADTAPAKSAPKDTATNSSPPNPKEIYAELKKTNPFMAARYGIANGVHDT